MHLYRECRDRSQSIIYINEQDNDDVNVYSGHQNIKMDNIWPVFHFSRWFDALYCGYLAEINWKLMFKASMKCS